jgi:hypothetical protein
MSCRTHVDCSSKTQLGFLYGLCFPTCPQRPWETMHLIWWIAFSRTLRRTDWQLRKHSNMRSLLAIHPCRRGLEKPKKRRDKPL